MLRMQSLSTLTLGGLLAVAVPLCVAQQSGAKPMPGNEAQASGNPARSASNANQRAADLMDTINKSEISTAGMIAGRTKSANVKDFAQMLVNDHKQAQSDLQNAANASNIQLHRDVAMARRDRTNRKKLKAEPWSRADKAFAASEVRGHEKAIRELRRLEPQITDPPLKTAVKNYIPVLRKHLDRARKLEAQLGKPGQPGQ
jgi:putative membrane protein